MVTGRKRTIKLSAFFATSDANLVILEEERVLFFGSGAVAESALLPPYG